MTNLLYGQNDIMQDNIDPSEWYDEDMPPIRKKDKEEKPNQSKDYDDEDYEVERTLGPNFGM